MHATTHTHCFKRRTRAEYGSEALSLVNLEPDGADGTTLRIPVADALVLERLLGQAQAELRTDPEERTEFGGEGQHAYKTSIARSDDVLGIRVWQEAVGVVWIDGEGVATLRAQLGRWAAGRAIEVSCEPPGHVASLHAHLTARRGT